jgi:hypothetical protein
LHVQSIEQYVIGSDAWIATARQGAELIGYTGPMIHYRPTNGRRGEICVNEVASLSASLSSTSRRDGARTRASQGGEKIPIGDILACKVPT